MSGKRSWLRYAPQAVGGLVVVVVAVGLIVFVQSMMETPPPSKKMVQQITLIQPPPPPPPPKLEKPPEPEVEEVKLEEPEPVPDEAPEPMADDAPLGDDLALDADGVAGGDVFGLLSKKGGRDLIGSAGGNQYAWYASAIQADIVDLLSENDDIRKHQYSVKVQLWIDSEGRVKRSKMLGSTGDKALDSLLKSALEKMDRFSERPPEDLPQPINLRVTSRI